MSIDITERLSGFVYPDDIRTMRDAEPLLWPWETEPRSVWSLIDMVDCKNLIILMYAVEQIKNALMGLMLNDMTHGERGNRQQLVRHLLVWFADMQKACAALPL